MKEMTENDFTSLAELYQQMDDQWNLVADTYHFKCSGCDDNCCTSLFFHHTFIERAYFLLGLKTLDTRIQKRILSRAQNYCEKTFKTDIDVKSLKLMCPANDKGRCMLYLYRPMICRLHGLPHELKRPGQGSIFGEGCKAGNFNNFSYQKFDRTPFYQQMSLLEFNFREKNKLSGKIRQSIAQIIFEK